MGLQSTFAHYGGAVVALTIATILRMALIPLIGIEFPFHIYWIVVAFVAYWWGKGPGLLTTLLGLAGARFFFIAPLHSLAFNDQGLIFRSFVFLVYCTGIILVTAAIRQERLRAAQARHRAEASEQRANRILDGIGDGFLVVDPNWKSIYANPRAIEISRTTREKLLGSSLWDVFPELRDGKMSAALFQALDQKRQSHFEDYYPAADVWWEGDAYPSDEGVTIFFHDITGRKNAELAIARHTVELQRKSDQLQRSNGELQQFAYAAAHDLQEPLRTISSLTRGLKEQHWPTLDSDGRDCVGSIDRNADRMRNMIADLLSYSLALSKSDAPLEQIDTLALAEMAVMNCQSAIDESHAVVQIGELPEVRANPQQLLLVFQNLISNAIKYRSADTPLIVIDASLTDQSWVFTFADNGMGIDMQYAERVFGVFRRLHGPEIPGTGIGLSLCKRIVENLGGRIWVESEPGMGAKFRFTLPAD